MRTVYQYFNVDRVYLSVHSSVRYGCVVTSATYTLGTRLQGLNTITHILGTSLLTVAVADMVTFIAP